MQPGTPGQDPEVPEAPQDPVTGPGCPLEAADGDAAGGLVVSWGGDLDLADVLAAMGLRERRRAGLDIPGWDEPGCSEPAGQAGTAGDPLAGGGRGGDEPDGDPLAGDVLGEGAVEAALSGAGQVAGLAGLAGFGRL